MRNGIVTSIGAIGCAAVLSTSVNAMDVKHEFGGAWYTEAYFQDNMSGTDQDDTNEVIEAQARIYYTANFDEKFKFVNKFEFDTQWGVADSGGDIGTDGNSFELKNSYVDFFISDTNVKVGLQGGTIARGFIFDDDFAGVTATFKSGETVIPVMWVKAVDNEDDSSPTASRVDYFAIQPTFSLSKDVSLTPYFVLDHSAEDDRDVFFIGADIDAKINDWSLWGSAIMQSGDIDATTDTTGYLVAAGAEYDMFHGQFFYASGDDDATDSSNDEFRGVEGRSYCWSEIMGEDEFGDESNGSPGDAPSNVYAINAGITHKFSSATKLTADLWYASLVEDDANGETDLGVEGNLKLTHKINKYMKLDLLVAYLAAGDATGEENPIQAGAKLSFKY